MKYLILISLFLLGCTEHEIPIEPANKEPYANILIRSLDNKKVFACENVYAPNSGIEGEGCYDTMSSMSSRRRLNRVLLREGIVEKVDKFNPMFGE